METTHGVSGVVSTYAQKNEDGILRVFYPPLVVGCGICSIGCELQNEIISPICVEVETVEASM